MDSLNPCIVWRYEFGYDYDKSEIKIVVDVERGALEYLIIVFSYKLAVVSRNIIMIAWVIIKLGLHAWIVDKQAGVGRNYCDMKCIFGHISIYKGGVAEIFKNIGDEYDNLLIYIDIYVN